MSEKHAISKSILAARYGFSTQTLCNLLNGKYFEELEKVGYEKTQKLLSPHVVRKFLELYGEPLDEL